MNAPLFKRLEETMKRPTLTAILALLCLGVGAFTQAQWLGQPAIGHFNRGLMGVVQNAGDLELRDPTQLSGQVLTNPDLTGGTTWVRTNDFALAADAATYTHSAGNGTFYQVSATAALPWDNTGHNAWYTFTYTVSAITGTPVCTIPATWAATAQTLVTSAAGTYSTGPFQATSPVGVNFTISCTSGAAATITFDSLSLLRIIGGDLTVQGKLFASGAFAPAYAFINNPGAGLGASDANSFTAFVASGPKWTWIATAYYPSVTDTQSMGTATNLATHAFIARSIQGYKQKTITDASATAFVRIGLSQTVGVNFAGGDVLYTVQCNDGSTTNAAHRSGRVAFDCVNTAGSESCAFATVDAGNSASLAVGSYAMSVPTFTGSAPGTDTIDLTVNADCTGVAGPASMTIQYRLDMPAGTASLTITPL